MGNGQRVIKCRQWVNGLEEMPDNWREKLDGKWGRKEEHYTEVLRSRNWGSYKCPKCHKEI